MVVVLTGTTAKVKLYAAVFLYVMVGLCAHVVTGVCVHVAMP